ncbi:MAG: isoprenylcysteine carboxyl methyltransferase family protein [Chloroherpetonaceae bacterium]
MGAHMIALWVMIFILAVQRIAELFISKRNEVWLKSQGGYEVGAEHYKYMVLLHITWFLAMIGEHYIRHTSLSPLWQIWLGVIAIAQVGRYSVITTLGKFWNTRIIVVPNAPLVKSGLYRFIKHPNYWIVGTEIAVVPLVFELYITSLIYTILNAIMLFVRIRVEEKALTLKDHAYARL